MSGACLSIAVESPDSRLGRKIIRSSVVTPSPRALCNLAQLLKGFSIVTSLNKHLHIYNVSVILVLLGNMIIYQQNTHGTLAHNIMEK